MKSVAKLINFIFRLLILNKLVIGYYSFKRTYIEPKVNKAKGIAAVNGIRKKGKDLRIHGAIKITGESKLRIGDYVRIGTGCYFNCTGGLTIGDNVQFSRNITIYTSTHDIESGAIPYDSSYVYKAVTIGNSVWIGMNVTIAPGTVIEDGAVIGMGTTVSGIIPKGAIVVGAKTRIIGYRDLDSFDKKMDTKQYFGLLFPEN